MNYFNKFILISISQLSTFMIYGQDSNGISDGTCYYSLLGKNINTSEFKNSIRVEKNDNYPKSLVFNYRINVDDKLDSVLLYGYNVSSVLLNVRCQRVCAINFLIHGNDGFWDNLLKAIGPPSSGGGIGIRESSPLSGTFFWKTIGGCISVTFGSSRSFGENGQFRYNILFALYDCNPGSILLSATDKL